MREERIDSGTFLDKFVLPLVPIGFVLAGTLGVPFFEGIQGGPPSPAYAIIAFVILIIWLPFFTLYHIPLKQVWVGEHGLRISNFCNEIVVPYTAVESVHQMTQVNMRYVIVTLATDTTFGDRFTFVPKDQKMTWLLPSGEDDVVIDLRRRIEAPQELHFGKDASKPIDQTYRSVMADDELDGPF